MSVDDRGHGAATAVRAELEQFDVPDPRAVVHRARRRQRVRRAVAATGVVTTIATGVVVISGGGQRSTLEVANEPTTAVGAEPATQWGVVLKEGTGLPAGSAFDTIASDGTTVLLAGQEPDASEDGWHLTIWRSEDGLRWERVAHPAGGRAIGAIAVSGTDALAVGSDGGRLDRGESTFAWRSSDAGRTWTEVALAAEAFGPDAGEMGRPFVSDLRRAGGWWVASGGASDGYAGIWLSRDGDRWTQTLASRAGGGIDVGTFDDGRLFAHTVETGWFSGDPAAWGEPIDLDVPSGFYLGDVAPGARLAVGGSWERHDISVLLRSTDGGRSWRADAGFVRDFPQAWLWTVDFVGGTWVIAGADSAPNRPGAWVSTDAETWTALPEDLAGGPGGTLSLIGRAGDTTVVLGTAPELDRYFVLTPP